MTGEASRRGVSVIGRRVMDPAHRIGQAWVLTIDEAKNEYRTWLMLSFVNVSGGSSGRRRRLIRFCLSVSRQSTGLCRVVGLHGAPCTRSWEPAATKRMAPSPPLLPLTFSDASRG